MKKLILIMAALAVTSAAHSAKKSQRPFERVDSNKNGTIELVEFLKGIPDHNVERMTDYFLKKDKDDSGYLTRNEYTWKKKKSN